MRIVVTTQPAAATNTGWTLRTLTICLTNPIVNAETIFTTLAIITVKNTHTRSGIVSIS